MKIHTAIAALTLSALVAAPACDVESAPEPAANIPELLGLGDDWYPIAEGVWARDEADGTVRHLGVGEAGRRHTVAAMEEVGALIRDTYESDPSPANEAALHAFQREFDRLQRPGDDSVEDLLVNLRSCIKSATASADVTPVTAGIKASSSSNFRNTCDSEKKYVSSYAYTQANYQSKTDSCYPPSGVNVTCSSSVTSYGGTNCYGYAEASAGGFYASKSGTTCGANPSLPPYEPPPEPCSPYFSCQPK